MIRKQHFDNYIRNNQLHIAERYESCATIAIAGAINREFPNEVRETSLAMKLNMKHFPSHSPSSEILSHAMGETWWNTRMHFLCMCDSKPAVRLIKKLVKNKNER